jgi:HlyD family secretion protein
MVAAKGSGTATDSVWVLRDGKPVSLPVTRGQEDGRNVAVSSDSLRPADAVIVGEKDGQSRRAADNQ